MWGMRVNVSRRSISRYLFNVITDPFVAKWYKYYPTYIKNGQDQYLLERFVWPLAIYNATIHDSYHCSNKALGNSDESSPFPTQRRFNCFVGQIGCCRESDTVYSLSEPVSIGMNPITSICPLECRPHDHKDWIYC